MLLPLLIMLLLTLVLLPISNDEVPWPAMKLHQNSIKLHLNSRFDFFAFMCLGMPLLVCPSVLLDTLSYLFILTFKFE